MTEQKKNTEQKKQEVIRGLLNARVIINAGTNKYGTHISGESCMACVRYIDAAILMIEHWVKED